MKKIKYLIIAAVLLLTGCKKEDLDMTLVSKTLFVGANFNEINLSDAWNVTLVKDEISGVILEYSAFLEDYFDVTHNNGVLNIGLKNHPSLPGNTVMNAEIHLKSFNKLSAKEAVVCRGGSFVCNASITLAEAANLVDIGLFGNVLDFQITDGADFKGNLTADLVVVKMDNASHLITYGGQVNRVQLNLDSASNLNMINTMVEEAIVTMDNASEATLYVSGKVQGTLRNASTLRLKGNPVTDLDIDISSSIIPL